MPVAASFSAAPRRCQRGVSLLESLIAFILLATGTLAVAPLQGQMRLYAELARQRAEAVAFGQREVEQLRAFSVIAAAPGASAYAAIVDSERVADRASGNDSNTIYRITQRIDATGTAGAKSASVTVGWTDRSGAAQRVRIDSVIAGQDPAYSASLALGAGDGLPHGPFDRSPLIPIGAHSLADGRSAWKAPGGASAYIFDDASGRIVGRCSGIAATRPIADVTAADLATCGNGSWTLLSGTIRFSFATPPIATEARDPPQDVRVGFAVHHAGGSRPDDSVPSDCSASPMKTVRFVKDGSLHIDAVGLDATADSLGIARWTDSGDRFVAYRCVVPAPGDGSWSGQLALIPTGWTFGTGPADRRVCSFRAGRDGTVAIGANIADAMAEVEGVVGPTVRNFLVIRGDQSCPGRPSAG
ncbi:MAG: hypothetical protein M3Z29_15005 [Pseudomonadota bacterium]|nr:hypothetical protein [Pseudomonadota bacterium]